MRLILDSHILLGMMSRRLEAISPGAARLVVDGSNRLLASAASFWEIAIKTRLGKLDPGIPLDELPHFFKAGGVEILPITVAHAIAEVEPQPPTRDPFDRLLLAQCTVEDARLVTLDGALRAHPLAARLAPPPGKPKPKSPRIRP